eukprot:scaffold8535_cov132-Cylindrotheca_fusiformis.AAC.15
MVVFDANMILCKLLCFFVFLSAVTCSLDGLAKIYDDVIDSETIEWLYDECIKIENDGRAVLDIGFEFPLDEPAKYAPMEQFLNDLLLQLYPNGDRYFVEYWTRRKWILVQSHADMDEEFNREMIQSGKGGYGDSFRHPEVGHVLYLKVGERVRGPTVIWNVTRGGDFSEREGPSEMIIVPAVPGRLTRFQGNMLHGVPRPADVFWTVQMDGGQHEPVDLWQRSVVLFNLWPVSKGKPGIEISNASSTSCAVSKTCNSFEEWTEVPIVPLPSDQKSTSKFKMPLMGDRERRGTESLVAKLETQSPALEAFSEASKVSSAIVTGEPRKAWFSFMGIEF